MVRKNGFLCFGGAMLMLLAGCGPSTPEGLLQVNGRIEGDAVTVASKYPGRVLEVLVKEGDLVEKDQIVARLEDVEVRNRYEQAAAAVRAVESQLVSAHEGLKLLKAQLPLGVDAAKANVARVQSMANQAKGGKEQMERDMERVRTLAEKGTINRQRLEQMELQNQMAASNLSAAQSGVTAARKQQEQAQSNLGQVQVREAQVHALENQLEQAKAALEQINIIINDLTIRAPARGTVVARFVEPGELGAQGSPLFELVNLDQLYLKAYVPQPLIGKIARGNEAQIYVDAYPDQPFAAELTYIASQAEFTPKEVQTTEARSKTVYAVKLYVKENPGSKLTPGMPADAMIRYQADVEWEKPVW